MDPGEAPAPGRSRIGFELRMAGRYLTTRRREGPVAAVTVTCAVGVLVGVASLVVALALVNGLQGDIRARLLAANPQVVVTPGWGREAFGPSVARSLASDVAADDDVLAAAPFTREYVLLQSRAVPGGVPALLKGVDPDAEDRVTGLASRTSSTAWAALGEARRASARPAESAAAEDTDAPLSAHELLPPEPPPVVLGVGLALSLGVSTGDLVHVVSPQPELTALGPVARSRVHRVVGLVDTGLAEYDGSWAIVALGGGGREAGVDGIQLALRDPLQAREVADRLAASLGPDVAVEDWTTTFARLFAAFRWEKLIMAIALGLIGVVAGFNILTILTMNVMARVTDVGVLAALGASRAAIVRIFVWMGLGLGCAGTLGGLVVGTVLASLLDRHELIRLDATVYLVSHVPFRVVASDLVIVAGCMVGVALLATLLPARAVAQLDPVEALRAG